jgi:spore coat protein U-like protein
MYILGKKHLLRKENMRKLLAITVIAAITAMAGSAMAATANLAVSATVANACSVTGGTLSFGALNTLTAPLASGTSAGVTVTCTKSDPYTVAVDKGIHFVAAQAYLKNASNTDTIPYSLTVPAVSSGTGAAQTIAITGTIAAGTYNTASAGTYNDTVVITVTP